MDGPYVVTVGGAQVSLSEGVPTMADIATQLCRIPMFAGATAIWYSVGHHCQAAAVLAAMSGETDNVQLCCLLHEAEVAVFGDIPGPVKCNDQRRLDMEVRRRIFASLGVHFTNEEWAKMEWYDKIEQAAVAEWAGLRESCHQKFWSQLDEESQRAVKECTFDLYNTFPPDLKLHSHLANNIVHTARNLMHAVRTNASSHAEGLVDAAVSSGSVAQG